MNDGYGTLKASHWQSHWSSMCHMPISEPVTCKGKTRLPLIQLGLSQVLGVELDPPGAHLYSGKEANGDAVWKGE